MATIAGAIIQAATFQATENMALAGTAPATNAVIKYSKTYTVATGPYYGLNSGLVSSKTASAFESYVIGAVAHSAIGAANTQSWTGDGIHVPLVGMWGQIDTEVGATGTFQESASFNAVATFSGGAMTKWSGFHVKTPTVTGPGTVVNAYGLYIDPMTGGTTINRAIHTAGGDHVFGGTTYIGDDANAKATLGLTINQGGWDDEIFALKSSDVAHGITDQTETDTFAQFLKASATAGGLALIGLSEATNSLSLSGYGVTDNTTKSTAGRSYITLGVGKKSGTAVADPGADANLVTIMNAATGTTRFIFDVEGSAHADVEWIAF